MFSRLALITHCDYFVVVVVVVFPQGPQLCPVPQLSSDLCWWAETRTTEVWKAKLQLRVTASRSKLFQTTARHPSPPVWSQLKETSAVERFFFGEIFFGENSLKPS